MDIKKSKQRWSLQKQSVPRFKNVLPTISVGLFASWVFNTNSTEWPFGLT